MRRISISFIALIALAILNVSAQDLQTRNLIFKRGTATTTLTPPSAGGPFTFTLPSSSTTGELLVNPTPLLSTAAMMYGVSAAQDAENSPSHFLFNVSYSGSQPAGGTSGARILSNATGGPGTATGLTVSATGGAVNYALLVPNGGGNVGIGTSTPGELLTVGTSGSFTVDASGYARAARVTVGDGGDLRINRTDNTAYSAFNANATQSGNITYTLPSTNGTAGQVLRVAASPAPTATTATLEWATVPLAGETTVLLPADEVIDQLGCTDIPGLAFTPVVNERYRVQITLEMRKEGGGPNSDAFVCFTLPVGATWVFVTTAGTGGSGLGDVLVATNVSGAHQSVLINGVLTMGVTAGDFQVQMHKETGKADIRLINTSTHIDYN